MKGIYLIKNKVNGKRYIGLSNNIPRRFSEHRTPKNLHKPTVLAKAFRKYTIDNFEFSVIEIVKNEDDLMIREMFWIDKIKPEYNMNCGGQGNLGHCVSDDIKAVLRSYGKQQWQRKTDQEKQRILLNLKGPAVGHSVSEKTREKLRQINTGKKHSDFTKALKSELAKKYMIGNSNGNKAVLMILKNGDEREFESYVLAAKTIGINPSGICSVINGRQLTAGGYKWKLKNSK